MSATSSVDKILASFPHQNVDSIVGEPNYDTINGLARVLKTNAASCASERGGGNLGHLGLLVSTAAYTILSPTHPFDEPPNPGAYHTPPAGGTAAQITAAERQWTEESRVYLLHKNTDMALKRQLLGSVEDIYMRKMRHRHTGYAARTTLVLLTHLFDTYGRITANNLEENETRFRASWSPNQPFEELVAQIEEAIDFADAGGSPFSDRQVVTNSYSLVFKTGAFPESCREWRRQPNHEKTWGNFVTDFTAAHNDYREMQTTTTGGAGYQQANSVIEEFVHDTTIQFANLAAATASDREVMHQLTKTNADLTKQLAEQLAEMKKLQKQVQQNSDKQGGGGYQG